MLRLRRRYKIKYTDKIKKLHKLTGITQAQMADKLGISFNQYNVIVNGKAPMTIERGNKIANILGYPFTLIFDEAVELDVMGK